MKQTRFPTMSGMASLQIPPNSSSDYAQQESCFSNMVTVSPCLDGHTVSLVARLLKLPKQQQSKVQRLVGVSTQRTQNTTLLQRKEGLTEIPVRWLRIGITAVRIIVLWRVVHRAVIASDRDVS